MVAALRKLKFNHFSRICLLNSALISNTTED
jgi:hypothetical protein